MAPRGSNLHDVLGRIAQDHQVARLGPQDVLELLTSVYAEQPKDKAVFS